MTLNPFHGNGVCPLKTPENLSSSDVFQGAQKKTSSMKWVKDIFKQIYQQNIDIHACSIREHAFL